MWLTILFLEKFSCLNLLNIKNASPLWSVSFKWVKNQINYSDLNLSRASFKILVDLANWIWLITIDVVTYTDLGYSYYGKLKFFHKLLQLNYGATFDIEKCNSYIID